MIKVLMCLCILAVSFPSLGMNPNKIFLSDSGKPTSFGYATSYHGTLPSLDFDIEGVLAEREFMNNCSNKTWHMPVHKEDEDWSWVDRVLDRENPKRKACKRAGNKKAESKFIPSRLTKSQDFYMGEPPIVVSPLDEEELWALGLLLSGEKGSTLNPLIDPVD